MNEKLKSELTSDSSFKIGKKIQSLFVKRAKIPADEMPTFEIGTPLLRASRYGNFRELIAAVLWKAPRVRNIAYVEAYGIIKREAAKIGVRNRRGAANTVFVNWLTYNKLIDVMQAREINGDTKLKIHISPEIPNDTILLAYHGNKTVDRFIHYFPEESKRFALLKQKITDNSTIIKLV